MLQQRIHIKYKLAPYGTDGRLFATDVCAKFKVMWHKARTNIKNPARSNLDYLPYSLRIRGQLPAPFVNGGGDSLWKWPCFQLWKARDLELTLNRVILHTVMHHLSTSAYVPNFIEIEETFCGRTYGQTDRFMNEYLRPALFGRPCRRVDLKCGQRTLTKGRIAYHAVIDDWIIPFAAYTAADTPNAFQWARLTH